MMTVTMATVRVLRLLPLLLALAGCDQASDDDQTDADTGGSDKGPVLTLSSNILEEGGAAVTVTVEYPVPVSVDTEVRLTLESDTGAATDLALAHSTLTLPAGERAVQTTLRATDDDREEGEERALLLLRVVGDSRVLDEQVIIILDDDLLPELSAQRRDWPPVGVFMAASECGACHRASNEGEAPAALRAPSLATPSQPSPSGDDISPFTGWDHAMMANALVDPYFRANVVHEVESFPHLKEYIQDTCTKCHAPMARTHAHHTGSNLTAGASCLLADGCYSLDAAMIAPHAREGISCTACHQITGKVLNQKLDSGNYEIIDTPSPEIRGPFQAPVGRAMENRTGYTPVFADHMRRSEHCRSCHDLNTPTIDIATNQPTGEVFPEQAPYTEWLNSDYAHGQPREAQCQDCHMQSPGANFLTRVAVTPTGEVNLAWPERSPYYPHTMIGANVWMLSLLQTFREELGLEQVSSAAGYADKTALTRAFLQGAASLEVKNAQVDDNRLAFDVTISNHAGHKLPTSFPARRVWLGARVRDAGGRILFENGDPDPDTHRLAVDERYTSHDCLIEPKPAGFDSGSCYMPHVNTVSSVEQFPIYEPVLRATDGQITHILLYADDFLKDNRIPPAGFDAAAAPEPVRPRGVAGDPDFNRDNSGTDTVAYRLPLETLPQMPLTVEVTLYYQSVRPSFIDGLHGSHAFIDQFHSLAAKHPPRAEVVASESVVLE